MAARHSFLTYRETYGFPVTLTGRQVVLQVGTVGVVTMPEPVGSVVQNLLQPAQLAGPVFADPKAGRWVFLVDGVPGISPAQQVILGEVGVPGRGARRGAAVRSARAGARAELVSPVSRRGRRRARRPWWR
ncbi:Uncharacterised protein [Mycobacteroides abscessus subsp. abscessus]|nr:Uncharacterised protein [Mycobacteroides abscessus subsp. abscessus]